MIKVLLVSSLMTIGLGEFKYRQAQAQVIWKPTDTPTEQPSPVIWETTISGPEKPDEAPVKWEIIPKNKGQNQLPSRVIWEILETKDKTLIPPSQKDLNSNLIPPRNLEEAETFYDIIPLQSSDFKPLLNLSYAVPLHRYWPRGMAFNASTISFSNMQVVLAIKTMQSNLTMA